MEECSQVYAAALVYMRDVVYSWGVRQGVAEMRAEMRADSSGWSPFAQQMRRAAWCDALIEAIQERSI